MEGRLFEVYPHYNSIICESKRVRRMRRTELSAQKLKNSIFRKKGDLLITRSSERQISKTRSIPKLQPRKNKQEKSKLNKNHLSNVHREYYTELRNVEASKHHIKNNSKIQYFQANRQSRCNFSKQTSNFNKSRNIQNSFVKTLKQNYEQIPLPGRQQKYNYEQETTKNRISPIIQLKTQKGANSNNPSSKILKNQISKFNTQKSNGSTQNVRNSRKKFETIANNKKSGNELKVQKLDDYGLVEAKKSKLSIRSSKNSIRSQLKKKIEEHNSKISQSAISNKNSKFKLSENGSIKSNRNSQINNYDVNNSLVHNNHNESNNISTNSKFSQNKRRQQNEAKRMQMSPNQQVQVEEFNQIFQKQISNLHDAQQSNFSKVKLQQIEQAPIIKGSSDKRQSLKDVIKSFTDLDANKSQGSQNSFTSNYMNASKKLQLHLDSMRVDKDQSLDKSSSKKLLSVYSKQFNRKSISLSSQADMSSLKGVIDSIQIHDYIVSLLNQFKEDTLKFDDQYGYWEGHQTQMLCFLLDKKHFLQKSNQVKALKGYRNIFKLSISDIPTQVLKPYLQTPEIKQIIRKLQTEKVELFQQLQKAYYQLKPRHKKNPYLKLQTPHDDFSKQIVRIINLQYIQVRKRLKQTNQQEQELYFQSRIFFIMQTVFLLSQLKGRIVKKIQLIDDVTDFEAYFKQYQQLYSKTVSYFQQLK